MRCFKIALFTAVFAVVALVVSAEAVDAAEVEYGYPDSLYGMEVGDQVDFSAKTTLENNDVEWLFAQSQFKLGSGVHGLLTPFSGGTTSASHVFTVTDALLSACIDGNGRLSVAIVITGQANDANFRLGTLDTTIPCSVLVTPPDLTAIQQEPVCGSNNDVIHGLDMQLTNMSVNGGSWENGLRTVTISANPGFSFEKDTLSQTIALPTFIDQGIPCIAEAPVSPIQAEICGFEKDELTLQNQPTGVNPVPNDTGWHEGERTVTYLPAFDYIFPENTETAFKFIDSGPCVTELPIPPVVTEVCGPDNDVVQLDANQPANVNVATDGEWTDGTWTITFAAAENYVLPQDATAVYNLVDEATPCPTDAPVSPVQSAVCGPNNDLLTFPDQPEGVTLDTDSDWEENERTVTFAISDEFITDGPTSLTFKDANEACPVIPVGKMVTVKLETSDGGSIEGTNFALDASVASQAAQPAYATGVVGANNTIVFENLMAGQYRLTLNAEGYEPVDEMIVVSDDGVAQEITIQVAAIQVPATPTPEPTAEPTAAPTAAPVIALPSTGTGPGDGSVLAGVGLVIATLLVTGAYVSRKSQE